MFSYVQTIFPNDRIISLQSGTTFFLDILIVSKVPIIDNFMTDTGGNGPL